MGRPWAPQRGTEILKGRQKIPPGGVHGVASELVSKIVELEVPPNLHFDAPVYTGTPFSHFPPGTIKVPKVAQNGTLLITLWASWGAKGYLLPLRVAA